MRTAIVYDRVNKWGGAERVLLTLHEMFPDAPLFTAVYDSQNAGWASVFPQVIPSFLQKIPILKHKHELLGMLTPIAFENINFDSFDLVISVTSEAAKGIITKPEVKHICYCLTPTRYLWSGYKEYLNNPPTVLSWIPFYKFWAVPILNYVRKWDKIASNRPDIFVAISSEVKQRIIKYYNRNSEIIFPPVNVEIFSSEQKPETKKTKYYLFVSRLIPYKKADLVVRVFNKLNKKLIVVGTGSEENKVKKTAGKNIEFINFVTDSELAKLYKNAEALIFPAEEDFGIVMVESLASGTPVIAYKKGGSLDIVKDLKTGVFFEEQSEKSLISAVKQFEKMTFNKKDLANNARKFSKERFKKQFMEAVNKATGSKMA